MAVSLFMSELGFSYDEYSSVSSENRSQLALSVMKMGFEDVCCGLVG